MTSEQSQRSFDRAQAQYDRQMPEDAEEREARRERRRQHDEDCADNLRNDMLLYNKTVI